MFKDFERGNVDYDYDMYKNRIRKYVVSGFVGKYPNRKPVWSQVEGFSPEKGFNNLNRIIGGIPFSEILSQKNQNGDS